MTTPPRDTTPPLSTLDDLLDLAGLSRPSWTRDAACRGVGADVFFPPRGEPIDTARDLRGLHGARQLPGVRRRGPGHPVRRLGRPQHQRAPRAPTPVARRAAATGRR